MFIEAWKIFTKAPWSAQLGVVIIMLNIIACVFAPTIAPFKETDIIGDVWEPGFWEGEIWMEINQNRDTWVWLGTDQIGRDLLTRLLYGARNTIAIAFITTMLSFAMGMTGGFLAATLGGWVDQILSRIVDVMISLPALIFSLMVLSILGTSIPVLIIVIAVFDATRVYRVSRAVAIDVEVMEYVEVARLRGENTWWLMRHEILPNTLPPLVAEFGLRFCFVFLFIATLSFLGLGIQPPTADWGSMVKENAGAISFGILTPLVPASAIALLTIGVNLVVDWFLHKTSGIRDEY